VGQVVNLYVPEPKEAEIVAEDLPLDIIYEIMDIIIINKQKGMVGPPCTGHATGTLVNALMYHCKGELSGITEFCGGIVHRIDRIRPVSWLPVRMIWHTSRLQNS
jgi:23S rRNA pseudouridine1911/1915/1917 synthase